MLAMGVLNPESGAEGPLELQTLWTPSCPREKQTIVPKVKLHCHPVFCPVLNMDFGGISGERLSLLTRITGHLLDYSAPLVGLAFHFADNSHIHFGRQGLMEVSHFIDGPAGERIVRVTSEGSSRRGIVCLKVRRTCLVYKPQFSSLLTLASLDVHQPGK